MTVGASLLVGVLAATGVLAASAIGWAFIERGGSRASAIVFSLVWAVAVLVPLTWGIFGGQTAWYAQAVGAYDFAGAIPFHIGGGVAALAITVVAPPARSHLAHRIRQRMPVGLILPVTVVAWTVWLVLMEFDLNSLVVKIIVNTLILAATAFGAAVLVQRLKTGSVTAAGPAVGVLSGLSAATAACAFLDPPAAVVVGLVAGGVAGSIAFSARASRVESLAGLLAITQLTGGIAGLLLLGLMEQSRGFFYTGGIVLPIAQMTAVVACLAYSAVVTFPLALVVGRRLVNRVAIMAPPD